MWCGTCRKKGAERVPHFAHYKQEECKFGYETSLHLAAKRIISREKRLILPSLYLEFASSHKEKELLSGPQNVSFDRVELEKDVNGIIPDIVCYCDSRRLAIEILVTHRIDHQKLEKIKRFDLSTIEIDLSKVSGFDIEAALSKIFFKDSPEKRWVYNSIREMWLSKFIQSSDIKVIVPRGGAKHIDDCPIKKRKWRNNYYANLIDDCLECEYCIEINEQGLICSGRQRISKTKDFEIPLEKRIKKTDRGINDYIFERISAGRCPNCNRKLCIRSSSRGDFVGCKSFPHCRFTASIDKETGEIIIR